MNEDIVKAIEVLNNGGIIVYPTDTIWGIGCDATNEKAVQKVYDLKKRIDARAMHVLVDRPIKVEFYISQMPDIAWDLIELAEKPLTIIYSGARNLAKNLPAEDGSVGIRVTNERFSKSLCERFRKAIVSTSANVSGSHSPECFSEISKEILDGADYVVNFRRDETAKSTQSSIIKLGSNGQVTIIRP